MAARPVPFAFLTLILIALGASAVQAVPSPPTERADRFGVYYWGSDISTWPGSPNRLAWGADQIAAPAGPHICVPTEFFFVGFGFSAIV